ncbi:ABC transporter permease [Azospirillum sp. TSO35-2]|uniref:ABC transporter permease n=1 Tax=Azospirillum sp. TSO35-2 TaxID=716796 RepID=UPI000D60D1D0|nr:ABC transporter permease [Azospirillum sp. TSO35-2]PWC31049.1 ABC transporter permease [Azospirillum sp. TSO35-2]
MTAQLEAPSSAGPRPSALAQAFRSNQTTWIGAILLAAVVLAAVLAPLLAPHDPLQQDILVRLEAPSAEHLLGTDAYGRDVLSRLMYGARISLLVGFASVIAAVTLGGALGIIAGYMGGVIDQLIMGVMDVLLSFPTLLLGLMVVAVLGASLENLIVAIAVTEMAPFARIARAPTLVLREQGFVEAGRALGFHPVRIMAVHILPNLVAELAVMASLWLATAIRTEASLSFIGLGVKPPTATWGGMIREGFENILDAPWLALFPSLAVLITVLALNLLGDGLRDAIDPKLRRE